MFVDSQYAARQQRFRVRLRDSGVTLAVVSSPDQAETAVLHALTGPRHGAADGLTAQRADALVDLLNAQRRAADVSPYMLKSGMMPLSQVYVEQQLKPVRYRDEIEALNLSREEFSSLEAGFSDADVDEYMLRLPLGGDRDFFDPGDQHIVDSHCIARATADQRADIRRRLVAAIAPRPTAAQLIETGAPRHLVIIGEAGQGKTSLTLRTVAQVADRYRQNENEGRIALRVTAGELSRPSDNWFPWLVQATQSALRLHLDHKLPDDFDRLLSTVPELVVIVDGLDEVTEPQTRAHLIAQLNQRLTEPVGRVRLVVTSRPLPSHELDRLVTEHTDVYELCSFMPDQVDQFSRSWFTADRGKGEPEQFLYSVKGSGLKDVITNPMFATIAAVIYEGLDGGPLPNSKHALMERLIMELLTGRVAEVQRQQEALLKRFIYCSKEFKESLAELCDRRSDVVQQASVAFVENGEHAVLPAVDDWVRENIGGAVVNKFPAWSDFILTLLSDTGLVVPHGAGVVFVHRSIADHLYANHKARQLPVPFDAGAPQFDDLVSAVARCDDHAIGVLVHYGQRCRNAAALLEWIQNGPESTASAAGVLLVNGFPRGGRAVERFAQQLHKVASKQPKVNAEVWWNVAVRLQDHSLDALIFDAVDRKDSHSPLALRALCAYRPDIAAGLLTERAESLPWARVDSITALITLGDLYAVRTLELLRKYVSDPSASGLIPIELALGLIKLCAATFKRRRDQVEQFLYNLLDSHYLQSEQCLAGVAMLASFETKRSSDLAATMLKNLAEDQVESGEIRLRAADALIGVDPGSRAIVERVYRDLTYSSCTTRTTQMNAHHKLLKLKKTSLSDLRRGLRKIIADDVISLDDRLWAANQLMRSKPNDIEKNGVLAFSASCEQHPMATARQKSWARDLRQWAGSHSRSVEK